MHALAEAPPAIAAATERTWRSAEERQATARGTYRAARQRGETLTGAQLGARYGRSERWGRDRIAEVRAETDGNGRRTLRPTGGTDTPAGNGNGGHPNGKGALPARGAGNGKRPTAAFAAGGNRPADGGNGLPPHGNGNGNRTGLDATDSNPDDLRPPVNGSRRPPSERDTAPAATASLAADTTGVDAGQSAAQRRVTTIAVVVVASVAAAASYDHQRALAEVAGEGWRSWLLPLSVDGLLTAATMLMLTRRRSGQPAGALTWIALMLGVAASVAANVVGADPTLADPILVGRLVAAWPPLALFLSLELLVRQLGIRQEGGGR